MKLARLCCTVGCLLVSSQVLAGNCPVPPQGSPALRDIDDEARLAWIDVHLAHTAARSHTWTWAWGTGIFVAGLANLVPVPFVARENRIDWYTASATTVVGILPLVLFPPFVIDDSRALRTKLKARAGDSDLCALLSDAETRLVRDADNEAMGQKWWMHAGNVVFNTAVGLFLGLGYHHWTAGALNAASGALVGELIIFTQPTETIEELRRYRAGRLEELPPLGHAALTFSRAF